MKITQTSTVVLDKIVCGGQALGTLEDGRKIFVWGGLPGETVEVIVTKKKSKYAEGIVTNIVTASAERVEPHDPESYLSTSPWQLMSFEAEQTYKAALITEAFELHGVVLPHKVEIATDGNEYNYRNKVEFSWYGREENGEEQLDLAFFRRGSKGKIPVDGTSLANEAINKLARDIRNLLRTKQVTARELKTLLIRSDQQGNCVWQLYVKDEPFNAITEQDVANLNAQGGEIIYSDPRSPASRITKRLAEFGNPVLEDTILNSPFRYATEGFFQINLPVYELALNDMKQWVDSPSLSSIPLRSPQQRGDTKQQMEPSGVEKRVYGESTTHIVDLYSGVGTIGLTIGGDDVTLVEINEDAVREMRANIKALGKNAEAVLAASEKALDYINANATIVVDPPRAGLHSDVIDKLLETKPSRVLYLSCNPVTQARDVSLLADAYNISSHRGYNFFPRTPHIEHLVVLELKT